MLLSGGQHNIPRVVVHAVIETTTLSKQLRDSIKTTIKGVAYKFFDEEQFTLNHSQTILTILDGSSSS